MSPPASAARRAAFVASLRRVPVTLVHPVVLTFMLASVLSYLSADTVRAAYLLAVGLALTWDRAHHRGVRRARPAAGAEPGRPAGAAFSAESAARRRAAMRRLWVPAVVLAAAYSAMVGSFQRYSWPATIAVVIPSAAVVVVAWRQSAESAGEPERPSWAGLAAWAFVWVGAAVWELAALFLQPSLATNSYAHPTLSVLADMVLGTAATRSVMVFGWLAFGWYLARR